MANGETLELAPRLREFPANESKDVSKIPRNEGYGQAKFGDDETSQHPNR